MVLENLGGDTELLIQIAGLFIADWPPSSAAMSAALAAADPAALSNAAHFIKGAAANLFAKRAVQAALELETTAKTGNLTQAPALVAATIAAVEELVTALQAEFGA